MAPSARSYVSIPGLDGKARSSDCDHSARKRWLRPRESLSCLTCWGQRLRLLAVILAFVGAILLSVSLFDPFDVQGDRRAMGISGIVLTGFAIIFATVTG